MNIADQYTYRVSWSPEDEAYVATVAELRSLSWLDNDAATAFVCVQQLARDVVDDLLNNGEDVPDPLAARSYSGKFMVRVPPEVHRSLALQAAEQGVSLNRLAGARLAS